MKWIVFCLLVSLVISFQVKAVSGVEGFVPKGHHVHTHEEVEQSDMQMFLFGFVAHSHMHSGKSSPEHDQTHTHSISLSFPHFEFVNDHGYYSFCVRNKVVPIALGSDHYKSPHISGIFRPPIA